MKQNLLIIYIITSLYLPMGFAQDTGAEPVEEVAKFQTYMIDHPFEGCPGGSRCTKKTGQIRKAWLDGLKNKKLPNMNFPLTVWSHPVKPVSTGLALWNSPCTQHNFEAKKIFLAEVMASDFKELAKQKNLIIGKTLLKMGDKKFEVYSIPRGEAPIYLSNKKMIYTLDMEGEYFTISIAKDDSLKIVKLQKPERFPENIACSEDMVSAFKKLSFPENLFKGTSCKSIWDTEAKLFRSIIYGWSCS